MSPKTKELKGRQHLPRHRTVRLAWPFANGTVPVLYVRGFPLHNSRFRRVSRDSFAGTRDARSR